MKIFGRPRLSGEIKRLARQYAAEGKPLNILNDAVFKAMLTGGSEDSREALRSLLSICTRREVSTVRVVNSEVLPEYLTAKTSRLDVHVTFNDGEAADLEMQINTAGDDLKKRAAYYASRLLSSQGKRGESYGQIKRVYQVFFVNGVIFPGSKKFPRRYFLMEEDEHDKLSEVLEVIFYELPKLEEKIGSLFKKRNGGRSLSTEEKWCTFIKYRHEEKAALLIDTLCREEEGIMFANRALSKVDRDYEKWACKLFREKMAMDERSYHAGLRLATEKAGAEGCVYGRNQEKLAIARKMKETGFRAEQICMITGLSPDEL